MTVNETNRDTVEVRLTEQMTQFCSKLAEWSDMELDRVVQTMLRIGFATLMSLGELVEAKRLDPAVARRMFQDAAN